MIISPKYKFIFFKPMKMAGSSLEASLISYCTDKALCAGSQVNVDADQWEYCPRNNISEDGYLRFHAHCSPSNFKESIKNFNLYEDYRKITCTRNPWDQVVSFYWYCNINRQDCLPKKYTTKREIKYRFENWLNTKFDYNSYVSRDLKVKDTCPHVFLSDINENFLDECITNIIRYENIQSDYERLCWLLFYDKELKPLQRFKSKNRKLKMNYSDYYSNSSKNLVGDVFQKTIKKFNYSF